MSKQRTITLTDRPPVRIVEEAWPLVAQSDWAAGESATATEARAQVRVRRHEDGRVLVYGTYRCKGEWRGMTARAGFLLLGGQDTAHAIRGTTKALSAYEDLPEGWVPDWQRLADECIASLPAEVI
jgi:hypothetical protein